MLDSSTLINVFNSDAESDGEDSPKFPQLPAEVVHHILPFWADVGGH